jgi:hypothetical protein
VVQAAQHGFRARGHPVSIDVGIRASGHAQILREGLRKGPYREAPANVWVSAAGGNGRTRCRSHHAMSH